ncbi:MAG: maleylpyruvate isomerase N-terminal domain-containing protein [Vicinamibacterales bacterium]
MRPALESLSQLKAGVRQAYGRLILDLRALPEPAFREPSLLPRWTRAHVATHIARNADSHLRLLEAAAVGRSTEQYVGGREGRNAEIEVGARRNAREFVADVERSSLALFEVWERTPENVWGQTLNAMIGERPAWHLVWGRWRELEIHHVDLICGYLPTSWPHDFVDTLFDQVILGLPARLTNDLSLTLSVGDGSQRHIGLDRPENLTIEGAKADVLAWMLGRVLEKSSVRCLTPEGEHAHLPRLAPWG